MATAHFREMRLAAGPHDSAGPSEIFKCTGCGAETEHPDGWSGEPDRGCCRGDCENSAPGYRPGQTTAAFRHGYDGIRWNTPKVAIP